MTWYWISTKVFTAGFWVDDRQIVRGGAPIMRKWFGKPLYDVKAAYQKYHGTFIQRLDP